MYDVIVDNLLKHATYKGDHQHQESYFDQFLQNAHKQTMQVMDKVGEKTKEVLKSTADETPKLLNTIGEKSKEILDKSVQNLHIKQLKNDISKLAQQAYKNAKGERVDKFINISKEFSERTENFNTQKFQHLSMKLGELKQYIDQLLQHRENDTTYFTDILTAKNLSCVKRDKFKMLNETYKLIHTLKTQDMNNFNEATQILQTLKKIGTFFNDEEFGKLYDTTDADEQLFKHNHVGHGIQNFNQQIDTAFQNAQNINKLEEIQTHAINQFHLKHVQPKDALQTIKQMTQWDILTHKHMPHKFHTCKH